MLIVDLFDDGAIWNFSVIVCVIIAIAVQTGGLRGTRATAADEAAASNSAAPDEPRNKPRRIGKRKEATSRGRTGPRPYGRARPSPPASAERAVASDGGCREKG